MRSWQLLSTRNPLWKVTGLTCMLAIVGVTGLYVARGPRPLKPTYGGVFTGGPGTRGRFGTVTEPLGKGLFVLSYQTITGQEKDLHLEGVDGRLEEAETHWRLASPAAQKEGEFWTLMGPMDLEAVTPGTATVLGRGFTSLKAPAMGWEHGIWRGLSPLVWDDLLGSGRGRWHLPAGWYRGLDGRFVVEHGPVQWEAAAPGAFKAMEAQRMWAGLGFKEGHMEQATAHLVGGEIQAQAVDIEPAWINWSAPITFRRDDGWHGTASHGRAPRPPEGKPFDRLEFQNFTAQRAVTGGQETVLADGARWTPAGLRLEGNVRWEQPLEGARLSLKAPRVLQRTATGSPGDDLPPGLPVAETWAEPQAVLTWGARSLSSPRIEGRQQQRQWKLLAPVLGRGEWGTFTAGEGRGTPAKWQFDGPVIGKFFDGSQVRGATLAWEDATWTLTGRPATLTRPRQRLAGPSIVRRQEGIQFPAGISGALAAQEGDINLKADRGQLQGTQVTLDGRVECLGQGWRLQADRISVTLGPGNIVKQVTANGEVVLRGRMGEGRGDALDLFPETRSAVWRGRVKAVTEVQP